MTSARAVLARGIETLLAAGIESARLDARVLLAFARGASPDAPVFDDEIPADRIAEFERCIARRGRREPLAYITGSREFWSLSFAVGPGVLIPRPETETLVEAALKAFPERGMPLRVLDIGTGSGCLLAAFLSERANAKGVGIDSSEAALGYARSNLEALALASRSRLLQACWVPAGEPPFDVVLSNPPYLTDAEFESSPPEIRQYEPGSALAAGPDGLASMRALAAALPGFLAPAGLAFVEIGAGQDARAAEILRAGGLEVRSAIPDLSGVPRCLVIGRPEPGGA